MRSLWHRLNRLIGQRQAPQAGVFEVHTSRAPSWGSRSGAGLTETDHLWLFISTRAWL
jgi:hypothetical protein